MTPARPQRKLSLGLLIALGLCAGILAPPALQAAEDPVVVNSHSGLAISGFDPVAYFTDGQAQIGRADLELRADQNIVAWLLFQSKYFVAKVRTNNSRIVICSAV